MCVMIFAGKRHNKVIELGIDLFDEEVGLDTDKDYILKNKGPGKQLLGEPTSNYRGKDIPCMCEWSEGLMTTEILKNIL